MSAARHDFVVVVPVADRPQHLSQCLASLDELLRRHPYPGRVTVLVADDSREPGQLGRHRAIADAFERRPDAPFGLHYLGQDEQRALVEAVPPAQRRQLAGVIGDGVDYGHKGASITRNIACLWLQRLQRDGGRRLFWFLDSDQEFRVNLDTGEDEALVYAIDYFNELDRLFSENPVCMVTGKVVGDPPVSPAVMAGTLLDDVLAFLAEMATRAPHAACSFHGDPARAADDAAYHDMADLFGFRGERPAYRYRCPLQGGHDHAACFAAFTGSLDRFFDGEHPTRRSYYAPGDLAASIRPARTIYTGNYVFSPAGLDWFIPFAALRLRMAGPTLGRIVRAELGDAFVSANLPMLHRRTLAASGQSEFRPGIERGRDGIDLSGEFERQYFGDVMLFTMERLAGQGFPGVQPDAAELVAVIASVEAELAARYRAKLARTAATIEQAAERAGDPAGWWQQEAGLAGARADFDRFIANLRRNFAVDGPAWRLVEVNRAGRLAAIGAAIGRYRDDRAAWRALLAGG
jgi:hypothetical protein